MSSFLQRLALRESGAMAVLKPRVPGLFEPAATAVPVAMPAETQTRAGAPPAEPDSAALPSFAFAAPAMAAQTGTSAFSPRRPPQQPQAERAVTAIGAAAWTPELAPAPPPPQPADAASRALPAAASAATQPRHISKPALTDVATAAAGNAIPHPGRAHNDAAAPAPHRPALPTPQPPAIASPLVNTAEWAEAAAALAARLHGSEPALTRSAPAAGPSPAGAVPALDLPPPDANQHHVDRRDPLQTPGPELASTSLTLAAAARNGAALAAAPASPAPTVQVTIGRLEIRATPPAATPVRPSQRPQPTSLDDYLRKREGQR
jgi:hypothetical protein